MPVFTTYTLVSKQYRQLGKVVGKSFYIGQEKENRLNALRPISPQTGPDEP
jgi:hypothetical protein